MQNSLFEALAANCLLQGRNAVLATTIRRLHALRDQPFVQRLESRHRFFLAQSQTGKAITMAYCSPIRANLPRLREDQRQNGVIPPPISRIPI